MPSNNTFNKVDKVTMKGLSLLLNELAIGRMYDSRFSGEYAASQAIGDTLRVPLSQRYTVQRNDMSYQPQAMDRPTTTIVMSETASLALEWDSIEKALDMERGEDIVEQQYLKPAISYIRQAIEVDLAAFAHKRTNMVTGALGTNPTTYDATSAVSFQMLKEMSCPDNDLSLFVPPAVARGVKTAAIGYYNPQIDLSKQFRTGYIGKTDSFDWYDSNSLYSHTAGTWASTVSTNGANQSGSTLNINCTSGDTFKEGDKFSIANVNQINQMTRYTTSTSSAGTKTFVVTADFTATASTGTISFYPPIYGPGSHYQNVDALPAGSAALTLWPGTASPNGKSGKVGLALGPGAFFIASKKLEEPEAVEICRQYQDPDTGIALRFIRQWVGGIPGQAPRMTNYFHCLWGRGVGLAEQCSVAIACA